jgi:hypothetical protein
VPPFSCDEIATFDVSGAREGYENVTHNVKLVS